MKTMTCDQLGGACGVEFRAETFEKMANLSMRHGKEMYEKGDEAHLKVMEKMNEMMKDPQAMHDWMSKKQQEFDELSEDR